MKIFILTMLLSLAAWSRLTDDKAEIKIDKEQISLTAKKGFHLNKEAPASATFDNLEAVFKPTIKTEKLFTFKKTEKAKIANVSFYVCDDKNTVCEQHKKTLNLSTGESNAAAESKSYYQNINDLSLVSVNKTPTLLVFSAPWCPACIRMQTESYNQPVVKAQIQKLNFVKLNSDVADNYELSEKFKIKAIPTMILLDKNGKESYRWLDFQSPNDFAKSLSDQLKKVDQAEATLSKAELGDPVAASTMAFKAYNTLDFAEAFKWFSLTKSPHDQKFKLAAEVSLAQEKTEQNEKLNGDYIQSLEKAIVLTKSKLDSIRWAIDYYEKKKEMKILAEEAKVGSERTILNQLNFLLSDTKLAKKAFDESTYGNYAGFEKEELLWLKSRFYGVLDKKSEKAKVDQETIALINKKKLSMAKPGEVLLAISYLKEAGEIKNVENLYEQLINKYPSSYVYFEKYARFLQKNKNLDKALTLTNEALKYPEGNEPQLSLLKTQILKDLNKKDEALAVIDEALKADYIKHKRFENTVKRLNDLKDQMNK